MRIGLVDVDGHHYPNLALMKLSAWHKLHGDAVEWYDGFSHYDRVYMSKVFDNAYSADDWREINADEVIRGGTGYGLDNRLPDDVEHIMPDYALYGITDTAYGFLTRGCPRHCGFCIVGDKEGLISHKVADLNEFWSGQPNIVLMDANILACRDRRDLLAQLRNSKARVDFNQGLDIRLMSRPIAEMLGRMRIKTLHFAWDNPHEPLEYNFRKFAEWYPRKKCGMVYVLTNWNSTMDEDLHRIYTLRDMGYDPYVMIYDKPHADKQIRHIQRWCNNKFIFKSTKRFEEYKA